MVGGRISCLDNSHLCGSPVPVEVYNEEIDKTIFPQTSLMQWKEKERFISQLTHNYPVDSGVRIPPAELYRVPQGEKVSNN